MHESLGTDGPYVVILWYFQGDPNPTHYLGDGEQTPVPRYFPFKISAEAAARAAYPNEDPDKRYARIRFAWFRREQD